MSKRTIKQRILSYIPFRLRCAVHVLRGNPLAYRLTLDGDLIVATVKRPTIIAECMLSAKDPLWGVNMPSPIDSFIALANKLSNK